MTIFRSALRLNCLSLLLVGFLVVLTQLSGLQVSDLFFHPFFSPNPNVALLTRTFQVLCVVPVIVCSFSYGLAKTMQLRPTETRFILFSALLTGAFLLNEIYRIHLYISALGIPKLGVSLLYAIFVFSYGWFFRRELQSTPYKILLAGLGLLFFAIGMDALRLEDKILASLLEGVPKLLSEINITFYYWYICKSVLAKSFHNKMNASL
ncbi:MULTISPECIES: hypothetical protein [unclassified Microcoleus]|uniref:hypothetical protein n=1 Tax=unclassified Microcoleus TaxID=2642155 RepID=UPI0025E8464A|nr:MULTISPECIES: hypothetical protein [unclassified Microcoleus]